jgi:hypothetical protein
MHGRKNKKLQEWIYVPGRRQRRSKQLLDFLNEKREYWQLKEDVIDGTSCRTCFGRGYGPIVRETMEWMNDYSLSQIMDWTVTSDMGH